MAVTATLLLLRKVVVLRRIGDQPIDLAFLIRALEDDEELIRTKRPDLYVSDSRWDMRAALDDCIDDGTVEFRQTNLTVGPLVRLVRTKLGEQFMASLDKGLASLADEAPMSQKNLLEWLAIVS